MESVLSVSSSPIVVVCVWRHRSRHGKRLPWQNCVCACHRGYRCSVFCMFTQRAATSANSTQMFGAIALTSATEINRQNNFRTFVSGLMLLFRYGRRPAASRDLVNCRCTLEISLFCTVEMQCALHIPQRQFPVLLSLVCVCVCLHIWLLLAFYR